MFIVHLIFAVVATLLIFYLLGSLVLKHLAPNISPFLYAPFGFITFQTVFWITSILLVFTNQSWQLLMWIVSPVLLLLLIAGVMRLKLSDTIAWFKKSSRTPKISMLVVLLLGAIHGILQIGFWNVDNSMSDNSFYVSIATAVTNSAEIWKLNPGDGMLQSNPAISYMIATYETSVAYLAAIFQLHPAAYMRIVMPIVLSIFSLQVTYVLFKRLLKKDYLALLGILAFLFTLYYSPNYKSNLNDYGLEEWFLYYNYVGKVIVRYLVTPMLFVVMTYVYDDFKRRKTIGWNKVITYTLLFSIIGVCYYTLSPGASFYYLSLLFVFLVLLLCKKGINRKEVVALGSVAITGLVGVLVSFMTMYSEKSGEILGGGAGTTNNALRYLGVNSEYYTTALIRNFFMYGKFEEYWYFRWDHILIVAFVGIALIWFIIAKIIQKMRKPAEQPTKTQQFWKEQSHVIFFLVLFPITYIAFTHIPPIVEVISEVLDPFVHQRLVGVFPYEIAAISMIIVGFRFLWENVLGKLGEKIRYPAQVIITMFSIYALIAVFLLVPARPFTYSYAMSSERRDRLRFQDEYYRGEFNYELLLRNPYKLDYQAEQIVSVISPKAGPKVVAGTINQFFGLSHVRNYDADIQVVKTRFSTYEDKKLADASYLLKIYFSPWEKDNADMLEKRTASDIKEALKLFDVNYLVVIKTYKTQNTFGDDMKERYADIIESVDETEMFYIFTLK